MDSKEHPVLEGITHLLLYVVYTNTVPARLGFPLATGIYAAFALAHCYVQYEDKRIKARGSSNYEQNGCLYYIVLGVTWIMNLIYIIPWAAIYALLSTVYKVVSEIPSHFYNTGTRAAFSFYVNHRRSKHHWIRRLAFWANYYLGQHYKGELIKTYSPFVFVRRQTALERNEFFYFQVVSEIDDIDYSEEYCPDLQALMVRLVANGWLAQWLVPYTVEHEEERVTVYYRTQKFPLLAPNPNSKDLTMIRLAF